MIVLQKGKIVTGEGRGGLQIYVLNIYIEKNGEQIKNIHEVCTVCTMHLYMCKQIDRERNEKNEGK